MQLIETTVLEIELDEEGPPDGRSLLLLHGWPDAARGWRPAARRLHKRGWRTLAAGAARVRTRFCSPDTPREGRGIALAADAIELLDAPETAIFSGSKRAANVRIGFAQPCGTESRRA